MRAFLYRISISACIIATVFVSFAEAQKSRAPARKSAAKLQSPAENDAVPKTNSHRKFSTLENAVVEELNSARSHPQKFVGFLEEYRKATKGNLILLPNRLALRTIEGVSAIDEAIGELKSVSNFKPLELSDRLSDAAQLQLQDLQEDASLGHTGKNGSTLKIRLARFATVEGKAGENICYRGVAGRDVAIIFIIDDNVKSRMHRKNVLNPAYKKIGVACGTGKNNDSICVTVFAESLKDNRSVSSSVEF